MKHFLKCYIFIFLITFLFVFINIIFDVAIYFFMKSYVIYIQLLVISLRMNQSIISKYRIYAQSDNISDI